MMRKTILNVPQKTTVILRWLGDMGFNIPPRLLYRDGIGPQTTVYVAGNFTSVPENSVAERSL